MPNKVNESASLASDHRVRALREQLARGEEIGRYDRRWLGRLANRLEVEIPSMIRANNLE